MSAALPLLRVTAQPVGWQAPRTAQILLPRPEPKTVPMRRKLWELGASLHCSVIGTCLTTGELRAVLRKCDVAGSDTLSEHELHTIAVAAAGGREALARLIHKTLDRRHQIAIHQAARARTTQELRLHWREATGKGDIPGAYWAALTHPYADDALIREAFGDVHMLSHLVGAANRADIRRLKQLEDENAALRDKVARAERQLRDGFQARDRQIRDLGAMLAARIDDDASATLGTAPEPSAMEQLVADLRRLFDVELRRRERAEAKLTALAATRAQEEKERAALLRDRAALGEDLDAAETRLAAMAAHEPDAAPMAIDGATVLYVGGPPHHVARLRWLVESASGRFVHHDGGLEEALDLLPGLISRSTVAVFPVDCVSHAAASAVKRHCRLLGKPFVPLRSSGMASLLRALRPETVAV